jgi:aryl-alcohol dehydrogenase-like predicted oxidoreductase
MSTRIIYGAAGLGRASEENAEKTLKLLFEYGINHIDVAASYAAGESEKRVGVWMQEHRDRFFLATKTGMRTYDEAKAEFHASLERLQVDSVDLIQMHNLTDPDEWQTAMGPGGVLEALQEAKEEGLTKFIGVTGHGLTVADMHLKSIERFEATSVLLPYNYPLVQIPEYAASFEKLVAVCQERNIAVQTIKSVARRPWGEQERTWGTWYQPLDQQEDIDRAVHWVLGDPRVFLASASDVRLLPKILKAASSAAGRPLDAKIEAMVEDQAMEIIFEGSKAATG